MGSRFIHLIRTDSNAFLFLAEYYSIAELFIFCFKCCHYSLYRNAVCIDTCLVILNLMKSNSSYFSMYLYGLSMGNYII